MRLLPLAKLLALSLAVFLICGPTSAQAYAIRVDFNTNLRAAPSLDASVVTSAQAGATLQVTGAFNRWLKISHNDGDAWMADWVSYTRVESSPQTAPQTPSAAPVDNCCFVDRECHSDQDWSNGYWAFQNGQCAASAQTQPVATTPVSAPKGVDNCCQVNRQCHSDVDWVRGYEDYQANQCAGAGSITSTTSITPITGAIPEDVDNCCFVNRQCHTEQDYVIGYEQFKYGLCHVPDIAGNIRIKGSAAFISKTRQALRLMYSREPKWYVYVQQNLRGVTEIPMGGDSGIYPDEAIYRSWPNFRSGRSGESHDIWVAGQLVHEACHVSRYKAGLQSGGYVGEKACTEIQIQALDNIDPIYDVAASRRRALANIDDPEHQWWRFH